MDAFEINKIAGAVLAALLVIFGSKTALDLVYKEHKPAKPGWALPVTEVSTAPTSAAPAAPFNAKEVLALLAKANADAGQDLFKRCLQCHTPDKGGPNRVGPNLWGIVDRARGAAPGFPYSDALKKHPGKWTFEELAKYLHDPKTDIPGNKMAFAGIKDNAELADLLVYLRKLSDTPAPLPQ
ncbi:MAG: cytochrome c family protein [Hyphomicrobiaceae bacterium]|nr:MAG: cytochrome c family protein [Hyphomicrobiaceae bacterium]